MDSYTDVSIDLQWQRNGAGFVGSCRASGWSELLDATCAPAEHELDLRPFRDLEKVRGDDLTFGHLFRIGSALGDALLPGDLARLVSRTWAQLPDGTGLRIRLRTDHIDLARLPWEYAVLWLGGDRHQVGLHPRLSLVRVADGGREPPPTRLRDELVVVSMHVGDVDGYPSLHGEPLVVPPTYAGRRVRHVPVERPTARALREALRGRVDVLYFSGHGEAADGPSAPAGLVLVDEEEGYADILSGPELAQMASRACIGLVVLSACHTADPVDPVDGRGVAHALVGEGVPAVVAMQGDIEAEHAARFCRSLFASVFDGVGLDAAVSAARIAVRAEPLPDYGRPVVWCRHGSAPFVAPLHDIDAERVPGGHARPSAPVRPARNGKRPTTSAWWSQIAHPATPWRLLVTEGALTLSELIHDESPLPRHVPGEGAVALAPDGRMAVALLDGDVVVARVDEITGELVFWPDAYRLRATDARPRVLAATASSTDRVDVVLSTERRTSVLRLGAAHDPRPVPLIDAGSRAAAFVAGRAVTVDMDGHFRDPAMRARFAALDEVTALDVAESGGTPVVAALGRSAARGKRLLVAAGDRPADVVEVREAVADMVVVRQPDPNRPPSRVLTAYEDTVTVAWSG